ncbi:hypothetical protein C9374_000545 [Naegleria lovaniensis]|uniref:H(+)-exporting diphosphatase n=1 Tax=Naegleria lovaniensis TaxID=51637 RepID=A0AA88GU01_NAELO|nr:uncharacterized protein C9374_000545 [Naegleria lovaniensis]KAG2388381.1 hypothetical protein C9374_000545 [Naegleria lovaniensis]
MSENDHELETPERRTHEGNTPTDDVEHHIDLQETPGVVDDSTPQYQEPKVRSIIYYVFIGVFLLLAFACTIAAFISTFLQFPVPDQTWKNTSFDLPMESLFTSMACGFLALFVMVFLSLRVLSFKVGTYEFNGNKCYEISQYIADGARAFLIREFQVLTVFVLVVAGILFAVDQSGYFVATPVCFLVGAVTSAVTSIIGMYIATRANVRTTNAARTSLNQALKVAFSAGTVMGLSVVGLGLVMLSLCYMIFRNLSALAGFGFGASSIALFARVGGGIYTKAADVGADLVGKVESNIPEDDPRNPAVIADNVGDNVGDVAGMGADLFESYVGSIIAAATLGSQFFGSVGVAAPFYLSASGILCSIIGSSLVSVNSSSAWWPLNYLIAPFTRHRSSTTNDTTHATDMEQQTQIDEDQQHAPDVNPATQSSLLMAIRRGIFGAALLNILLGALILFLLFDPLTQAWAIFLCFLIGIASGVLIGLATEYCTSFAYRPTKSIAESGLTGAAPVIIKGLSVGMLSTVAPVIIIVLSIIFSVLLGDFASGGKSGGGIYGIAIAAVGMLSTLGVTLATDAYGPIADNAGGIAEMSHLPPLVRERTDALDALGNTTAATGKGFAIGSAILTALALLQAFATESGITTVSLLEKEVMSGLIVGACLPYIFSALTMTAVGDAAMSIIVEVRRQFKEIDGLLEGRPGVKADHTKCVDISTKSSLKKMILPGLLSIIAPVLIGFAGRQKMLAGLLGGSLSSGFLLAVTMANAGGAWDNAKKYIESGALVDKETGEVQRKGSNAHKSCVVGDTVGDPFKDTSGPALNILIKLMTVIALVIAPVLKQIYVDQ